MKAELIDSMGTDLSVVNAARVSFDKESDWEVLHNSNDGDYEYIVSDKDAKLISYLAKHNHWTPFSHCMITMRETVPIFVARQRFKHMVGFTYNEVSRRYVDDSPEFYIPEKWRKRADNVKQGSSDKEVSTLWFYNNVEGWECSFDEAYSNFLESCEQLYDAMLKAGAAPEQARMILPQSMYTSYYVTGSLAAWARAYKLRSDSHSQKEIQELAEQWNKVIHPLFPISWEALVN